MSAINAYLNVIFKHIRIPVRPDYVSRFINTLPVLVGVTKSCKRQRLTCRHTSEILLKTVWDQSQSLKAYQQSIGRHNIGLLYTIPGYPKPCICIFYVGKLDTRSSLVLPPQCYHLILIQYRDNGVEEVQPDPSFKKVALVYTHIQIHKSNVRYVGRKVVTYHTLRWSFIVIATHKLTRWTQLITLFSK